MAQGNVASTGRGRLGLFGGAVALFVLYTVRRKRRKAKAAKASSRAPRTAEEEERALIRKKAKGAMWKIFLPSASSFFDMKSMSEGGVYQLAMLLVFHVYRVWQNLRLTYLVKEGDRVIFTRAAKPYWTNQRRFMLLMFEMATSTMVSTYLKRSMAFKWRARLAKTLHEARAPRAPRRSLGVLSSSPQLGGMALTPPLGPAHPCLPPLPPRSPSCSVVLRQGQLLPH